MDKKNIYHIIIVLFLFTSIFTVIIDAYPIPIYGRVIYENGEKVVDANVNITSDLGILHTVTDSDGYFQLDCGDPINWPIGTKINIKISKNKEDRNYSGDINTTIYSNYVDLKNITIASEDNTDYDKSSDNVEYIIGSSDMYYNGSKTVFIDEYENILIDTNNDTIYDKFYNNTSDKSTDLGYKDDIILIDDDNDNIYDYIYNPVNGSIETYSSNKFEKNNNLDNKTPGFSILLFLFTILLLYLVLNKKQKRI